MKSRRPNEDPRTIERHGAQAIQLESCFQQHGQVQLLEELQLAAPRRAFVMVLEEAPSVTNETALLSEAALAED